VQALDNTTMVHTMEMTLLSTDLKHPVNIFGLLWLFVTLGFIIFCAVIIPNIFLKLLFVFISLGDILIIIKVTTDKIIISNESVTKKMLFRSKSIKYSEIKKMGVYLQEPKMAYYLDKANYDKKYLYRQKLIYISTEENYNPIFTVFQKNAIKFHYNKRAFEEIENKSLHLTPG
jgi:hypothetical protein